MSAAAGADDEPPGEDDPASAHHSGALGSERGQRLSEAVMCPRGCARGCLKFDLVRKT